ncbi:mycothiol synthase [Glaciibacter psychrotolerans]|uniref:Mycothiol acetyltransferase n=1 Tax=Glaciibacter psychrotolerans TaxID=670054 RepID=A0A7Z0EHE3_9MICO|nr:mycothiol synthase [Leifsonia psychrotolerans]NYJ21699.1 mycothiol synthase [Leifsonia psychrotolerans]
MSLSLNFLDSTDASGLAELSRIADAATQVDGYRPFNEQTLLDLVAGRRAPVLLNLRDDEGLREGDGELEDGERGVDTAGTAIGAAVIGDGEFDLVIAPEHRGFGHGDAAVGLLLPHLAERVSVWAHGDHPAARVLAERHRFVAVRTLLQLRLDTLAPAPSPASPGALGTTTVTPFVAGQDEAEWLALNALVFASHPEQGALTLNDLAARLAEPWFDAGDFLVARDPAGRMIGYNWLKIEPGQGTGEIYVIGIHPDAAGHGLGRLLMQRGLVRMAERGCTSASLYVEADNEGAVRLYRSLGFTDFTIDVRYERRLQ